MNSTLKKCVSFFTLDGGLGTYLQSQGLPEKVASDRWNTEKPGAVLDGHLSFLKAGANVIFTNTFCGSSSESVRQGLEIGFRAKTDSSILLAGDLGPGHSGDTELLRIFSESAIDLMVFETMTSAHEAEFYLLAFKARNPKTPVMVLFTLNEDGTLSDGRPWQDAMGKMETADILGFNCSFGPAHLFPHFHELKNHTAKPIAIKPSKPLSMPSGIFAEWMMKYAEAGASYVGGCCGAMPEDIAAFSAAASRSPKTSS